jgi:quercetin dioxygenase-like cupin family protein
VSDVTPARAFVVGPDHGEMYWQPVPANGYVRNILSQAMSGGSTHLSLGTQTVAPRSFIREHTHADNEEIIHVLDGRGTARLDGIDHPIVRGSTVYIGRDRKHQFLNPHTEPMTFLWIMTPGGLDAFFAEIGRPRVPSTPAPDPFARPENIAEIEARTVFGWTDTLYGGV